MKNIDQKILEYLLEIPKGKVSTYKRIGERFWVHPRKVAAVMRYNKNPEIYPCYKVISESGKLSGYSGEDWINGKVTRLKNDGIEIVDGVIAESFIV
jgi:O6-methylguanine-DNA--protein-cysteine methyltransferase